jgi:hypothetical protein
MCREIKMKEKMKDLDITSIIKTLIVTAGLIFAFIKFGTELGEAKANLETVCGVVKDIVDKQTKTDAEVSEFKSKYARFEGVMGERTQNIQSDVKEMKADIKTLLENLELAGDE